MSLSPSLYEPAKKQVPKGFTVLVVDDDETIRAFLQTELAARGYECKLAESLEAAEALLRETPFDMALLDIYLDTATGLNVLDVVKMTQPNCACVMMTGHATVETVAHSFAAGALEYLSKPFFIDDVVALIKRVQESRLCTPSKGAPQIPEPESAIVGRSAKMVEVYRAIAKVALSNAAVMITGAGGTGKELVARTIHSNSARAKMPFVPVNCGAFSEALLESELFGHEKGAVPWAQESRPGLLESIPGGSVFLDEIAETTSSFQVNLLRVIQDQAVRRVGSNHYLPVDVRILAATSRDIEELVRSGVFRDDLYQRLNAVNIHVPSLDERREDIPALVQHFLRRCSKRENREIGITREALQVLSLLPWPGQVRELENFVERLAIFSTGSEIGVVDVQREREAKRQDTAPTSASSDDNSAATLKDMERQHILRAMKEAEGNKSKAARALGIDRKTLYQKARRLGIDLSSK